MSDDCAVHRKPFEKGIFPEMEIFNHIIIVPHRKHKIKKDGIQPIIYTRFYSTILSIKKQKYINIDLFQ